MYSVWTSVKVKTATQDHEREGEAGTVFATNAETHPAECVVIFDTDGTKQSVSLSDLVAL